MKKLLFILLFFALQLQAQKTAKIVDKNYLEDQLYVALTYDVLQNRPVGINQNGFSGGIAFGFIKDLPINKERDRAFGIGFGYAYHAYIQNLKIDNTTGVTTFSKAINATTNRLAVHAIDMPIEFRWRNSTPTRYKFWRIYSGVKISYLFSTRSKFVDNLVTIKIKSIDQINKLQYGLTTAVGYGTWNFYLYYGLNTLFDKATIGANAIDIKTLEIGLKFYIL